MTSDFLKNADKFCEKRGDLSIKDIYDELRSEEKRIPTGVFPIDYYLLGGIPEGKVSVYVGEEHSGKSTLAMKTLAQAQKKYPNKIAYFFDMEGHFNPDKAEAHGIDLSPEKFRLLNPLTTGAVADIICYVLDEGADQVSCIVVDSLAACTSHRDVEKSADDNRVANSSLSLTILCNDTEAALRRAKTQYGNNLPAIIFINQYRANINKKHMYESDLKQAFAAKIRYISYCTIGLGSGKNEVDKESGEVSHILFRAKFDKIKMNVFPPKGCEFTMVVGSNQEFPPGFVDDFQFSILKAKQTGLHNRATAHQKLLFGGLEETTFGSSKELNSFLFENPDKYKELKQLLLMNYRESKGKPRVSNSENFLLGWLDNGKVSESEEG